MIDNLKERIYEKISKNRKQLNTIQLQDHFTPTSDTLKAMAWKCGYGEAMHEVLELIDELSNKEGLFDVSKTMQKEGQGISQ